MVEILEMLIKYIKKNLGPLHNLQSGMISNIFGNNLKPLT